MAPGRHRSLKDECIAAHLAIFLHDNCIGACRQRGAGKDARRLPGAERTPEIARRHALRDGEFDAPRARHVRCAHRVTIHGAVVETGHIDPCELRSREHPSARGAQLDAFVPRHGTGAFEQKGERLLH